MNLLFLIKTFIHFSESKINKVFISFVKVNIYNFNINVSNDFNLVKNILYRLS